MPLRASAINGLMIKRLMSLPPRLFVAMTITDQVLVFLASFVGEISELLQQQRILEYSLYRFYQVRF